MSQLGVQRFGLKESKPSTTGQNRLNNYLQRLHQPQLPAHENNTSKNTDNDRQSIKRKLDSTKNVYGFAESDSNSNSVTQESPHKKIKLSSPIHASNAPLSIEDNIAPQTINISPTQTAPKHLQIDTEYTNDDSKDDFHPIYNITTFPKPKLPSIINPEKTLMPKPIWMKKGNKIITDIHSQLTNQNSNDSLQRLRLDKRLINALKSEGYKSYFPVQINVIPAITRGIIQKRDIAVCAPTGSGKTLAYVLPICHILSKELSDTSHNLRALVVSPSRDLALQLYLVFEKFGSAVGLKVGLSAGQRSLKDEQSIIINSNPSQMYKSCVDNACNNSKDQTVIDVLVCTPGRLVNHLNHTNGFNLKNLQFLILDEADRLLQRSYQDWLFRVYHMIDSNRIIEKYKHSSMDSQNKSFPKYNNRICLSSRKSLHYEHKPYLLKILLSATLTHNPKIISSLKLNNPLYFGSFTDKQYLIPSSIAQSMICCSAQNKLCTFISLIDVLMKENKSVVCFCDSVNTAHRLKRVVEIAFNLIHKEGIGIGEFSRMVSDRERPHILRQFRAGKIKILICSDAMSRGLDIPSLDCVINYECMKNIETYVHRIGRTARGIGNGNAYTIVGTKGQKRLCKMLKCVENGDKLTEYRMDTKVIRFHKKYLKKYSELLNEVLNQEQDGELVHNDPISAAGLVVDLYS